MQQELDWCFFNSSNKCVDARNYDEMSEIILEST